MNLLPKLDEIISVCLPKGEILSEGRRDAKNWINIRDVRDFPDDWEWVWTVTGKKEYVGTFPKRVANYMYKEHNIKIPPGQLSVFGADISKHVSKEGVYYVDFTRNFNWKDGQFGDKNSCYWGKNKIARELLYEAGGMAMRFWSSPIETPETCPYGPLMKGKDRAGLGRAWLLKRDNIYVLFNIYISNNLSAFRSYGLEARVSYWDFPRTLAHILGTSYKEVPIYNGDDETGGVVYINGGFVVGNPENIDLVDVGLDIDVSDVAQCKSCETYVWSEDLQVNGVCSTCWDENYFTCEYCGESYLNDDSVGFGSYTFCQDCYDDQVWSCEDCGNSFYEEETSPTVVVRYRKYCNECVCEKCGESPKYLSGLCEECCTVQIEGEKS